MILFYKVQVSSNSNRKCYVRDCLRNEEISRTTNFTDIACQKTAEKVVKRFVELMLEWSKESRERKNMNEPLTMDEWIDDVVKLTMNVLDADGTMLS